ncbi:MAG: glycoside hydrolase family 38 C-terminal domain-containing protein [Bacillota bacterium]
MSAGDRMQRCRSEMNMPEIVIVPHTHWDREWYLPFQCFRARLVHVIDELMQVLEEDPCFAHFTLDGQTIVLEDYLEVRPEKEKELGEFIRSGRVLVGPWYVLPDETLVSAEALICNLERGMALARRYGTPMTVGYLPDQFGHIGAMPQILRGFGLEVACLWRGVGPDVTRSLFSWLSREGSRVLCIYMPQGYANALELPLDPEALSARVQDIVGRQLEWTDGWPCLLMNGNDHHGVQVGLPGALAKALSGRYEYSIGSLPAYAERVVSYAVSAGTHTGELRSPLHAPLLVGVYSTRSWIKQEDWAISNLLEQYAEPLAAMAGSLGGGSPADPAFLDLAWKYLFSNQAHDSICGCSVDQVYRDMRYRYDQARMIALDEVRRAGSALSASFSGSLAMQAGVEASSGGHKEKTVVVVYNPGTTSHDHLVEAVVRGPLCEGPVCAVDAAGRCYPAQAVQDGCAGAAPETGQSSGDAGEADGRPRWWRLIFAPGDVPALGLKAYLLTGCASWDPTSQGLRVWERGMENEFFRVEVGADGTLSVTDRETGVVYEGINRLVDGGDRGDMYNYHPPANDTLIDRPVHGPATCTVEECGPVRATMRLDLAYEVPSGLAADRTHRSCETVRLPITTRVSLMAGVRRVEFKTIVENRAKDHRFRVHFPACFRADYSDAGCQFEVVRRAVDLPRLQGPVEVPAGTHPHRSFIDISDGKVGLAVSTRGLPEYEVLRTGAGSEIAITLLRCVGWLSRADLVTRPSHAGPALPTPDAQCQGKWSFDYAIFPHRGDWHSGGVHLFAQAYQSPAVALGASFGRPGDECLQTLSSSPCETARFRKGSQPAAMPPEMSFLSVSARDLVFSALRSCRDGRGVVVRYYDVGGNGGEARLRSFLPIARVSRANLAGQRVHGGEPVLLSNRHEVALSFRGHEIVTLRVDFADRGRAGRLRGPRSRDRQAHEGSPACVS